MVLQFQPPPDWLIQSYVNRPNPATEALTGAHQVLQAYAQQKALKLTQDLAQEGKDIDLAKLSSEGGSNAIDTLNAIRKGRGQPPLMMGAPAPATMQSPVQNPMQSIPSSPIAPQPTADPTPTEESNLQSMPSEHILNSVQNYGHPDVTGHLQSTSAPMAASPTSTATTNPAQPSKPVPPALGSDPAIEEFNSMGSRAFQNKYGTVGLAKVKTALDIQKGLQEKNSPVTIPQYSALQSGDPKDLSLAYPQGIPSNLATAALGAQSRNVRVTTDPYGNPIRVPVAGGPATPVQLPTSNLNPLQRKLNPNEYKTFQSEVNDFDKDKTVADNRTALNNMANVETMVKNYNPALTGPIASRQARAIAGEVGVLTDSDVARQSLDPSLLGRLKKAVSVAATGELPKDQLDLLKTTLASIKQGAQSRIYSVAQERATRLSNQFGGKVSADELMGSMNLPSNFSSQTYKTPGQSQMPTVSSQAQYDSLPSGTDYLSTDGTPHRKK